MEWWFGFIQEGGKYCAGLLLGALIWLNNDRNKLIARNTDLEGRLEGKSKEVMDLAERVIAIAAELKMFLFTERKT